MCSSFDRLISAILASIHSTFGARQRTVHGHSSLSTAVTATPQPFIYVLAGARSSAIHLGFGGIGPFQSHSKTPLATNQLPRALHICFISLSMTFDLRGYNISLITTCRRMGGSNLSLLANAPVMSVDVQYHSLPRTGEMMVADW